LPGSFVTTVLCPHLKLDWFRKNGRSSTQIQRIREAIVAHYHELFKTVAAPTRTPMLTPQAPSQCRVRRQFGIIVELALAVPIQIPDDIESYLDTPPVRSLNSKTVLQFWSAEKATQPSLAKMGLMYCSAPANLVDSERVFSERHNQCVWNQRSMSSQIFREQMSVGAWSKAPFFQLDVAKQLIDNHSCSLYGSYSI
jgi:hypothetical protein